MKFQSAIILNDMRTKGVFKDLFVKDDNLIEISKVNPISSSNTGLKYALWNILLSCINNRR